MSLSFLILLFFLTLTFFVEFYASWNPTLLSIFSVSSTFHRFPLTLLPSSFITLRHLHARLPPLVFSASAICFSRLLLFEPFQILCKYKHFLNRFKVFFIFLLVLYFGISKLSASITLNDSSDSSPQVNPPHGDFSLTFPQTSPQAFPQTFPQTFTQPTETSNNSILSGKRGCFTDK